MATNGEAAERPPPPSLPGPSRAGDFLGKHRLSASISRLNQEIEYLEKELNELETMAPSSAACKEVISSIEGKSDVSFLLHLALRILLGTGGSNAYGALKVVYGGCTKVLMISLNTRCYRC